MFVISRFRLGPCRHRAQYFHVFSVFTNDATSFASNTRLVNCTLYTQLTQRKHVPTLRVIATLATARENLIFSIGNSKCKHEVAFTHSFWDDADVDHDHEPTPVKFRVV